MNGTDMCLFQANGASSYQADMYANGEHKPTILPENAYTTVINDNNATLVEFLSTRPMQATAPDSYVIPLD